MKYIGKIDKSLLGSYKDKIITDDIVLTDERKIHILEDHGNDFDIIMENIDNTVLNPNEIKE